MTLKNLETQRKRRLRTNNASTKKYEKTKKGFLMRVYRNMKSRVEGVQNLFDNWENNNYDRKICPSIDRKDSSKGYF